MSKTKSRITYHRNCKVLQATGEVNTPPGEIDARQDLLKALSCEVSGLRIRGARRRLALLGKVPRLRTGGGGAEAVRAGRESVGSLMGPKQGMGSHPYMVG